MKLEAASMTFEVPPLTFCDASMFHGVASMHKEGLRWIFINAEVSQEGSDAFSQMPKFRMRPQMDFQKSCSLHQ